jgi:phage-related tail fiber protein
MSNTLRIKRRVGGSAGAPTSLENAELAFNETGDVLYYGKGTGGAGGSATAVIPIAGSGAFVDLSSNQSIDGTKTFLDEIVADISGNAGTAETLLTARNFSASGDATASAVSFDGSAAVDLVLTLANSGVTAGTYTKVTVDSKGRVTVGATASLSDLSAPTADFSFGGYKLTNLAEPVSSTDAATKNYVDSVAQGLDIKASSRAATTSNITLSGEQTIDGVSLVAGDRVLVKNQSTASENGIYVVAAGSWTRASDADTWAKLVSAFSFIEEGTTQSDTSWVCTVNQGGTLGSTAVTFTQFGAASEYLAGDGLSLTGNTFAAVGTSNRISVSASGIDIDSNYQGQTSITKLGTITTGEWQGIKIGVAYGGTGLNAAVTGLLKGDGTGYAAAVVDVDYLDPNSTIDGGTF